MARADRHPSPSGSSARPKRRSERRLRAQWDPPTVQAASLRSGRHRAALHSGGYVDPPAPLRFAAPPLRGACSGPTNPRTGHALPSPLRVTINDSHTGDVIIRSEAG